MFGINFSEIILIFAVALIVLGPKQLPQIASKVGLIIYSIKNYIANLKQEVYFNSGAHELINTKNELVKTYTSIRNVVMPYNKIDDYEVVQSKFEINDTQIYQPEFEFDRQPELFDDIQP